MRSDNKTFCWKVYSTNNMGPRRTMKFVQSLGVRRKKAEDAAANVAALTLEEIATDVGWPDETRGNTKHWAELITSDVHYTRPYFDTDAYYATQPASAEIGRVLSAFEANIVKVLQHAPSFTKDQVVYGQRHGVDAKHKLKHPEKAYKVSFRAWVCGFKVQRGDLKARIMALELAGEGNGLFDTSIYKPDDQLLACMGCSKGRMKVHMSGEDVYVQDARVLQPIGPSCAYETYLAQHLTGQELEVPTLAEACPPVSSELGQEKRALAAATTAEDSPSLDTVEALLNMLSVQRWDDRETWIKIGMLLKKWSPDHKAVWLKHSAKSSKADALTDPFTWDGLTPGDKLSMGTLRYWAKQDSPHEYSRLAPAQNEYLKLKAELEKHTFYCLALKQYMVREGTGGWTWHSWLELLERHRTPVLKTDREGNAFAKAGQCARFIQLWRDDPERRCMDRLDFLPPPLQCPTTVQNLWEGYRAASLPESVEQVDISLILQHLYAMAGGKGTYSNKHKPFRYLVSYLAHMFQRPGEVVGVMLVMYSQAQGVGKSWIVEYLLPSLMGENMVFFTEQADAVFGSFNKHLMNKVVVNLDEASGPDVYRHASMLKAKCTQEKLTIQPKGKDTFNIRNFSRYIFTTNDASAVPVEKSDRRVAYFSANCEHANERPYHSKLRQTVKDEAMMQAVYEFFMSWDLDQWDPVNDRPVDVQEYVEAKVSSLPVADKFSLLYVLQEQEELDASVIRDGERKPIKHIYAIFQAWQTEMNIKNSMTAISFARALGRIPGWRKVEPRTADNQWSCDSSELQGYYEKLGVWNGASTMQVHL